MKRLIKKTINRPPISPSEDSVKDNEPTRASRMFSGNMAVDLVISPNEISYAHGTGVLLSRLMSGHNDFIAMRSRTDYGGTQNIDISDAFALPTNLTERSEIFDQVAYWLKDRKIRSILCAPFFETDLKLAIAAQAYTGAPLGLWIMDDNCIQGDGIDQAIMKEAITRSSALFAISPELKLAYQTEFRKAFTVLPPLVSPSMLQSKSSDVPKAGNLVMIGNIWSAKILEKLAELIAESSLKLDWYSSNPDLWSSSINPESLAKKGVFIHEGDNPEAVRNALKSANCVIIPSDTGDAGNHEKALGSMSLPTRMPFVIGTAGTPMIVVSRPGTAAASFVSKLDIGSAVDYNADDLKNAVKKLSRPAEQKRIRQKCFDIAPQFSFDGAKEFVFHSIQNEGRWSTDRFEKLIPIDTNTFGIFVDKPVPEGFNRDFGEVLNLCDRLKAVGFVPDFILDIGASTAIWSHAVHSVYDQARYILCDPMFSRYPNIWSKPGFELVEAAISNKPGEATFSVSEDLYGSSLIRVSEVVSIVDKVTVPLRTVDNVAKEKKLKGRGLMKIDVQYAEHLVIEGALKTIKSSIDIVILELTLAQAHKDAQTLLQVANRMNELGFRIFDQVGGWRFPNSGELEQLDVAFVRKGVDFAVNDVPINRKKTSKPVRPTSKNAIKKTTANK